MMSVAANPLIEIVENLRNAVNADLDAGSSDGFELFEQDLNGLDAACREMQQKLWADEARTAVKHLERDEPLTPQDLDVIRVFLISDAERYVAMENNFLEWVNELKRLLGEIAKRLNTVDRDNIADVRGLLKDAVRLAPDIRNYLDEKKRIQQCKAALGSLDRQSREILAKVLKDDLATPSR